MIPFVGISSCREEQALISCIWLIRCDYSIPLDYGIGSSTHNDLYVWGCVCIDSTEYSDHIAHITRSEHHNIWVVLLQHYLDGLAQAFCSCRKRLRNDTTFIAIF